MENVETSERTHLLMSAYLQGLRKFRDNYGTTERITAEKFARERFMREAEPKINDPRFPAQAPDHAYFCLLMEHQKFNSYARQPGIRTITKPKKVNANI